MPNLQEEIEKAFIAGAEYMREECYAEDEGIISCPLETEVQGAAKHYTNKEALVGNN